MKNFDFSAELETRTQFEIGRLLFQIASGAEASDCISRAREGFGPNLHYLLIMPLNGTLGFNQKGRKGAVAIGEYVLLSHDDYLMITAEASNQFVIIYIPSSELRNRLISIDDHLGRRFCENRELSNLLFYFICDVIKIFYEATHSNSEALATQIINLVSLTISSEDRGISSSMSNGRFQLRKRIFEFIEREVTNPNLTPKKIAAYNRVSLSYLYSLFNDSNTTVGQFILEKRLQKAFELLAQDLNGNMTVSEIAYQVGFKNVSHFSRTFSRHYNMAPRDVHRGKGCSKMSTRRPSKISPAISNLTEIYA